MFQVFILILFIFVNATAARAALLLDLDATISQDTLSSGTDSSSTKNLYGGGVYVPVDNKQTFYLGATFLSGSSVSSASAGETTFTNQDIILGVKWFMDRNQTFILSAGYGLQSKAYYQDPSTGTAQTWDGTSIYAKLTIAPRIGRFNAGMSIIYYQGTYAQKTVSSTVSNISNSRAVVIPGFALAYSW